MSEAKIRYNGGYTGTAWLIHEQFAITAAHCVAVIGTRVDLLFENPVTNVHEEIVGATVVERDAVNDGALLRLDAARAGAPILQPVRLHDRLRPNWRARGFPSLGQGAIGIFEANGGTGGLTTLAQDGNPRAIQLNLAFGALAPVERYDVVTNAPLHALAGMSGSAVTIAGGAGDGRVIGLIRCSIPQFPQDIVYATPLSVFWPVFAPHFGNPPMLALDRQAGRIIPDPVHPGGVLSSIDDDLVGLAWGDPPKVTDLYIDFTWDGAAGFREAIIRLALHQPGILRLHVRDHTVWAGNFRQAARQWMALEAFDHEGLHVPCIPWTQAPADEVVAFPGAAAVGRAVHFACDRWILAKLHEHLNRLFVSASPRDLSFQLDLAPDVCAEMEATWRIWHPRLVADGQLLHHFLALLLTQHGDFDSGTMPCPGAGPRTLMDCVIRGAVFGLAVAPFLPTAFHPKFPQPGNVNANALNGHVCGIRGLQSTKLERALRNHAWRTHIVVLRQLEQVPEQWQVSSESFATRSAARRTALNLVAPTALVIACDEPLCNALAAGAAATRDYFTIRMNELRQAQEEYANNATP